MPVKGKLLKGGGMHKYQSRENLNRGGMHESSQGKTSTGEVGIGIGQGKTPIAGEVHISASQGKDT